MRSAWIIAREELRYALRQKVTLLWVFVMPPIFFAFIGGATGGEATSGAEPSQALRLEASREGGWLAEALAEHLDGQGFELDGPAATDDPVLRIPDDFTSRLLAGETVGLELENPASGPRADLIDFRVQRAAFTTLADLAALTVEEEQPSRSGLQELRARPRAIRIESHVAGRRRTIPSGYSQAVPGTLVMFTLMVLLTSGASQLVAERRLGLLRRLASAPVRRGEVILGKWGGRIALGWVQILFAMLTGTLLFEIDWGDDLGMVLAVLAAWGGFCGAAGLFLGAVSRTPGQAVGVGVLGTMVLAALGGCWWPIEVAPAWMQSVQKVLPSGWAMDALHRLVHFGAGPRSAVPHLVALVVASLMLGWMAAHRLQFDRG